MEESFFVLFAYFLLAWVVSIFIHELGHALVGRWSGMLVTSFGIGTRRPLFSWSWLGMRVYVCTNFLGTAITHFISPRCMGTSYREILTLMGGLLFNLALALVSCFVFLFLGYESSFFLFLILFNFLFFMVNVIPFTFKLGSSTLYSDGAWIRSLMRGEWPRVSPALGIETATFLTGLFEQVHDRPGWEAQHLAGAGNWAAVGAFDTARTMFEACDKTILVGLGGSYGAALALGCTLETNAHNFDEANSYLAAARIFAAEAEDPVIAALADLLEVDLLLVQDRLEEAACLIDTLSQATLPPAVVDSLEAARLALRMACEEAGTSAEAPLLGLPEALTTPKHVSLQFEFAGHLDTHQRIAASQDAYHIFLKSWESLLQGFFTPAHRLRFMDLHRERVERALAQLRPCEHSSIAPRIHELLASEDGKLPPQKPNSLVATNFWRFVRFAASMVVVACLTFGILLVTDKRVRGSFFKLANIIVAPAKRKRGQSVYFAYSSLRALKNQDPVEARHLLKMGMELGRSALYIYEATFYKAWGKRRYNRALYLANHLLQWKINKRSRRLGHFWRGRVYLQQGKAAKAAGDFSMATRLAVHSIFKIEGRVFWAKALEKQGKPKQALALCKSMSHTNPKARATYSLLRHCLPLFTRLQQSRSARVLCYHSLIDPFARVYALNKCRTFWQKAGASRDDLADVRRFFRLKTVTRCEESEGFVQCRKKEKQALQSKFRALRKLLLVGKKPKAQATSRPASYPTSKPARPLSRPWPTQPPLRR